MIRPRWKVCVGMILLLCSNTQANSSPSRRLLLRLPQTDITVDPTRDAGLRKIIALADSHIQRSHQQEHQRRTSRREMLAARPFSEMSAADLKAFFSEPKHFVSDKDRRGWQELRRLAGQALNLDHADLRQDCLWQMREITAAMRNNHKSPSPPH